MSTNDRVEGALVRIAERVDRVRQRRQSLRASELEQHLGSELGGQRLDERTSQRGDRRIRRALRERRVCGRPEDVDDPVLAASRHLLDVRDDALDRSVEPEQEPRRTLVAQLELALCEVAVDGGLHERVDEAQRRLGTQDLRTNELPHRCGDGVVVDSGERADGRELGAVPQDGDRASHPHRIGREPRQPEEHRARGGARAELGDDVDVRLVRRHPLRVERLQELVEQERIALRRGVAGLREGGCDSLAQSLAHDLHGGVGAEESRREHQRGRVARELGEERLVRPRLRGSQAADHEDREAFEPPGQIGQEAERGAVAPVQIVDREQERSLRAQVHRQPVQAVERGEGPFTRGFRLGLQALQAEDRGGGAGGAREDALAHRLVREARLVELADDPEREVSLQLAAAGR